MVRRGQSRCVVVHAIGGWVALAAVLLLLLLRLNRDRKDGAISAHPPADIPFLALGFRWDA